MKGQCSKTPRFVVRVENSGYEASLEARKIYPAVRDPDAARDGDLRIIDESGEDYLYSARLFREIDVRGTAGDNRRERRER